MSSMNYSDDERRFFLDAEQQFASRVDTVDLGEWRQILLNFFDDILVEVVKGFKIVLGRDAILSDDADRAEISAALREVILNNWMSVPGAPFSGDHCTVVGEGVFHLWEGSEMRVELFNPPAQLSGTFETFDVQPYFDPDILSDLDHDSNEDFDPLTSPFGAHIVLRDVTISDDGEPEHYDQIHIPLHYPKLSISKTDS